MIHPTSQPFFIINPRQTVHDLTPRMRSDGSLEIAILDVGPSQAALPIERPVVAGDLHETAVNVEDQWIWHGYLARGSTTLLTSLWKSGKTTLLAHLLAAVCNRPLTPNPSPPRGEGGRDDDEHPSPLGGEGLGVRGTFCGQPVAATRCLVLSEESKSVWNDRVRQLGITNDCSFMCRPFRTRPDAAAWTQLLMSVANWVKESNIGLVVFDPLAMFIPGDENVSKRMLEFLQSLTVLTEQGAAVLLLHHPRKNEGTEGRAARGSGALPGFVDVVMEMRRLPGDTQRRARVLSAYSRFQDTPTELVIELAEDGSGYRAIGSRQDLRMTVLREIVQAILSREPHPITLEEISQKWPADEKAPALTTLDRYIAEGVGKDWQRTGAGRKGSPFRYHAVKCVDIGWNAGGESAQLDPP